jgi:DNA-binding beta-propeller fold protein YncE
MKRLVLSAGLAATVLALLSGSNMSARTRVIGADRITSIESLPEGDACVMPGAENTSLPAAITTMERMPWGMSTAACELPAAALQNQAAASQQTPEHIVSGPGTAYQARTRSGQINRAPLRYLKDPYAAWSSIAVNAENDMVVLTDENLFRIVEYSRKDNTPAGAPLSVPRRVIGGHNTYTEMLCGSYVDPKTLEIYVTNNDTQDWMPTFSREARGDVKPDRLLATPHQSWGIAADEIRQEIYLTVQGAGAVVVYRKGAEGTEPPLRVLEGPTTQLADPHGIAIDHKNDLVFIANHGHSRVYTGPTVTRSPEAWRRLWQESMARPNSLHNFVSLYERPSGRGEGPRGQNSGRFEPPSINVYARGASGNAAPLRVIRGPRTQLNWPSHVGVHEGRGEIFVANDGDDSVLVFRITDSGDVAPTRVIKGGRTRIKFPTGVAVDPANNELWVASMGNYTIAVFPIAANGDVEPIRQIRGGPEGRTGLMIGNPGAVGYDSKRQEILVPN